MPKNDNKGGLRSRDWLKLVVLTFRPSVRKMAQLGSRILLKMRRRRELAQLLRESAPIRFCPLEPRRVLNASFDLVGSNLQLSNFSSASNLDVSHDSLTNSFQFTLSNGTWFDSLGANTGNNVLSVLDSILTGTLQIDSAVASDVLLSGDLGTLNEVLIDTLGQVSDSNGTQLQTTGLLSIKAGGVTLGEQSTDVYQLGQISLDIVGNAQLHAVGSLDVVLSNSGGSVSLTAGSLSLESVNSQSNFEARATDGDIMVGSVSATSDIRLTSVQGSILDAQDDLIVDLSAGGSLSLTAAHNIQGAGPTDLFLEVAAGSKVHAQSTVSGDVQLWGIGTLELTQISTADGSITIRSMGAMTASDVDASATDSVANFVDLKTTGLNSDLFVNRVVAGINHGQVSITANRNIVDGDSSVDDLDVIGGTINFRALNGWVGAEAGISSDVFTEAYQADMSLEVRWLNDLHATAGVSVVLNPDNAAGSATLITPTAVLVSDGDVNLANVDVSQVTNLALIADADGDSVGTLNLSGTTSVSGDLRIQGQDIVAPGPLDFQASRMLLISNQAEQFAVDNLIANSPVELDGRTTGNMTVTSLGSLKLVDLDTSGSSLQSTTGAVLVSSSTGSVTVLSSVQADSILLSASKDLVVSAALATSGNITLIAAEVQQNAALTALGSSSLSSSIYVRSTVGDITMSASAITHTVAGNIVYDSAGDLLISGISSTSGRVALVAVGSIEDGQADTVTSNLVGFAVPTGNARVVNLNASEVQLSAGGSIGKAANPFDVQTATLAAQASSHVYLYESDAVSVGIVSAIVVARTNLDGSSSIQSTSDQNGLTSKSGHAKLENIKGQLNVQSSVIAQQDVLLASGGNIQIDAKVQSTSGAIDVLSQGSIQQNAGLIVTGGNDPIRNSIVVQAVSGSIKMSSSATSNTSGGNIAYLAVADVVVGSLNASAGDIYVNAGGSILDAQADTVGHDAIGFATSNRRIENLIGNGAQLIAKGTIGVTANPLDTSLKTIAIQSGGSCQILETDSLKVATVLAIPTTQVQLASTTRTLSPALISGVVVGAGLMLETIAGDLEIAADLNVNQSIQLAAQAGLKIDANVTSQVGSISLLANKEIHQNADIQVLTSVSAANSVFVQSVSSSIEMSPSARTISIGGNILYQAATSVSIGQIVAPKGSVAIDAVTSVLDSQLDTTQLDLLTGFAIQTGAARVENIVADKLILRANDIGQANNSLDIATQTLAVDAGSNIWLLETNQVEIGSVPMIQATLNHNDSTNETKFSQSLSGLRSQVGQVSLQTLNGSVVVSDSADVGSILGQSRGVAARGDVLLAAGGTGNLVIQASVLSEQADVWLASGGLLVSPPMNSVTDQTAIVQGEHLTLYAGINIFLPNVQVDSFEAKITAAQNTIPSDLFLNQLANQSGTLILNDLQHGPTLTNPSLTTPTTPIQTGSFQSWIDQFKFTHRFADGYSLFIRNHDPLVAVQKNFDRTLNLQGQSPGVYIETLDPSGRAQGASNLVISGQLDIASNLQGLDPGIVLIANGDLIIQGSVNLVTPLATLIPKTQSLNTLDLNALAYNGGVGDPRFLSPLNHNIPASTEYVVDPLRSQTEDYRTHVLQRVLMDFGSPGESGFLTLVHYADNAFQVFQNQGQTSNLTPGSEYQLQTQVTDLHAISNTSAEAALFTRATDFTDVSRFFLQNNRDLPTDVVIRRSLDYFMFSNTQSGDVNQIVDHASYSQEVLNVKSLGTSSMGPITPIPDGIAPPPPPTRGETAQVERPLTLILPQVELRQVKSEAIEVAIYQISYDDRNHNGQVENSELPAFDDVLNRVDEDSKLPIESKNAGQSPTQGEIDEVKTALMETPDQPSGAYAIIRKNSDGKQEVLEVFAIRDWPEGTDPSDEKQTAQDPMPSAGGDSNNDDTNNVDSRVDEAEKILPAKPTANLDLSKSGHATPPVQLYIDSEPSCDVAQERHFQSSSRIENAAAVIATLVLLHNRSKDTLQSQNSERTSEDANRKSSFLRSSRRQRRIKRLLESLNNTSAQDS